MTPPVKIFTATGKGLPSVIQCRDPNTGKAKTRNDLVVNSGATKRLSQKPPFCAVFSTSQPDWCTAVVGSSDHRPGLLCSPPVHAFNFFKPLTGEVRLEQAPWVLFNFAVGRCGNPSQVTEVNGNECVLMECEPQPAWRESSPRGWRKVFITRHSSVQLVLRGPGNIEFITQICHPSGCIKLLIL